MLIVIMVVVMLMVMAAAAMLLVIMVMILVVMAAAAMLLVIVVMMLMVMAAAAMLLMMMVMLMGMLQLCQFLCQSGLASHSFDQLCAGELIPRGGHHSSLFVVLPDQRNGCIQLVLRNGIGTGEDDGGGGLDLVVIELTEVLHVDLDLARIRNGNGIAQRDILIGDLLHGGNDVGQLAHTGGFDHNAIRGILRNDLRQRLAEIAHKRAADAAGVHLRNVNAGFLQETAVDTNFAELVLDQNQLLTCVGLLDHLLDQRSLTGTEESGINVDRCHR